MLRLIPRIIYLFLLLLFTLTSKANAQLESVEIEVNGLACPFCSYGLEKKLKKIDGLKEVKIFIDEGLARLEFEKSPEKPFEVVNASIKDAGFTPGNMKVTLKGIIQQENESSFIDVTKSNLRYKIKQNKKLDILLEEITASKELVRINAIVVQRQSNHKETPECLLSIESYEWVK